MYRLISTPLTGLPQPNGWAQVIASAPQNFLCCLSLKSVSDEDPQQFGRELATRLLSAAPTSALDLHQLIQNVVKEVHERHFELQLAALSLLDDRCVLATYQAKILLRREQKIGQILASGDEVLLIEGKCVVGDLYVLATNAAESYLSAIQEQLTERADAETFTTHLMPLVHAAGDSSLVAIGYVQMSTAEELKAQAETPKMFAVFFSNLKQLRSAPIKIRHWFARLLNNFSHRDVYVRRRQQQLVLKIVAPIIVMIVVIFFLVHSYQANQAAQVREAQTSLQPLIAQLNDLKKDTADQPIVVRQKTEDVITQMEKLLPHFQQKKTALAVVQRQLDDARNFYQNISGLEEVNVLPTFYDLRLVQSNFLANRMDINANSLFFLDSGQKRVIGLDIDTKQTTLLPTDTLSQLQDFGLIGKTMYLLGGGISQLNLESQQPPTTLFPSGGENADATQLRTYGTYVYLLNPVKHNIFRYAVLDQSTLSSPSAWVRPDQKIDYSTEQSFAIDGDVWLTTKTGEIHKYTNGREQPFVINGLKENFTTPISLFTQDGLDNLYILEPQKNRLVVISKKGDFVKEIRSQTLAAASAVVALEKQGRAFVLSGSMVFEVKL